MTEKEVAELRRRFRQDKNSITHIRGCYANRMQMPQASRSYLISSITSFPKRILSCPPHIFINGNAAQEKLPLCGIA